MSAPSRSADESNTRYQSSPIQVSSVGFNTLKKQPTNSSSTSSLATSSSKSRPLTRLFTRNKQSVSAVSGPIESSIIEKSVDTDKRTSPQTTKSFGIFNVTRRSKPKLNLNTKSSKKPELTIQTGGHGNLKIPKKILSSDNGKEFHKSGSPVSRYPLYRPSISSFAENQHNGHDEVGHSSTHYNVNPNRTAVTLSSQSSNSFITDVNSAVMFNFTDPDFSGTSDDQMLDLHRRYMTSADYYMQKLHKSPNAEGSPVSSNPNNAIIKDEKSRRGSISNGRDDDRIFSQLFDMLRPLFTPSQDTKLQNGCDQSQMTLSVEHVAIYVKENILPVYSKRESGISYETEADRANMHKERSRANTIATTSTAVTAGTSSSYSSSGQIVEDDSIEIQSKELASKLSLLFSKCFQTLARDLELREKKTIESEIFKSHKEHAGESLTSNALIDLRRWKFVCNAWSHFNSKPRFFLLHMLFPVEIYYDSENSKRLGDNKPERKVKCEKELLLAFRDTFIIPLLRKRSTELDRLSQPDGQSSNLQEFLEAEKFFFSDDPLNVKDVLTTCFGILSSYSQEEKALNEDMQSTNFLFIDFVQCFDCYTRA